MNLIIWGELNTLNLCHDVANVNQVKCSTVKVLIMTGLNFYPIVPLWEVILPVLTPLEIASSETVIFFRHSLFVTRYSLFKSPYHDETGRLSAQRLG
jgi:hypothetical protein